MRIMEVRLFTFDELSDAAKEKARQSYREGALDYEWYDFVYDDAKRVGKILGIEIDKIWFSGFWSQGDGACFEGSYSYAKESSKRIREYAPQDTTLHGIADNLVKAQKPQFYQLTANTTHSGRYQHSGCMRVNVEHADDPYRDIDSDSIVDELRGFADWVYSQLETEYEYLMSDECVDESILANGYEFDESGNWR